MGLNRKAFLSFTVALLIMTAHRLPAPIIEIPAPTPAAKEQTKPKKIRSHAKAVESGPTTKSEPKSPATRSLQGPARFAGTWRGVLDFGMFNGTADVTLTIDASATSVNETNRVISGTRALKNNGTSVSWREGSLNAASWTFTPNPDGKTASVRLTAPLIDNSAIFHRAP